MPRRRAHRRDANRPYGGGNRASPARASGCPGEQMGVSGHAAAMRADPSPDHLREPASLAGEGKSRIPLPAPASPEAAVMAAREAARNAQTLDQLRWLLEAFEGCALRATATQLVFADGNPQSRVMFVGEAPVTMRTLSAVLRWALWQIARSDDGSDRARSQFGLHRQCRAVAAARQPYADPQETAICLRSSAARSSWLIRISWSVSAARRCKPCSPSRMASPARADAGFPTIPHREIRALATFHPAFLLRSPLQKRFAWRDFLALKKRWRLGAFSRSRPGSLRPLHRDAGPT